MNKQRISSEAGACDVHNICVYCGSGMGKNQGYQAAARTLGKPSPNKESASSMVVAT
jgi:predicted Rossmann-fold nucleotide-binding protein